MTMGRYREELPASSERGFENLFNRAAFATQTNVNHTRTWRFILHKFLNKISVHESRVFITFPTFRLAATRLGEEFSLKLDVFFLIYAYKGLLKQQYVSKICLFYSSWKERRVSLDAAANSNFSSGK